MASSAGLGVGVAPTRLATAAERRARESVGFIFEEVK